MSHLHCVACVFNGFQRKINYCGDLHWFVVGPVVFCNVCNGLRCFPVAVKFSNCFHCSL